MRLPGTRLRLSLLSCATGMVLGFLCGLAGRPSVVWRFRPAPPLCSDREIENRRCGDRTRFEQVLSGGKAVQELEALFRAEPPDDYSDVAGLSLARILLVFGNVQRALNNVEEMLRRFPESPSRPAALKLKADALSRLGRDAEAKAARREIVSQYPESWVARTVRRKGLGR